VRVFYASILAAILLFPFAFAEVDRARCSQDEPCLPAELKLTAAQQQRLQQIYERRRQEREALRQQTRDEVLQVLTPEQAETLRRLGPELLERRAGMMRKEAEALGKRADALKTQPPAR